MTQSSGQTDATIWNKCWQHLESSYRYAGTSCQHTKTTWRNASTATHAVSKRALHPRSAAPSKLQSKMASANAAMPVPAILFQFREYLSCLFMAASRVSLLPGSPSMSNEGPRNRQLQYFFGTYFLCSSAVSL